jgi:hypothetical protein
MFFLGYVVSASMKEISAYCFSGVKFVISSIRFFKALLVSPPGAHRIQMTDPKAPHRAKHYSIQV